MKMIRMMTLMITIIVASSALPKLRMTVIVASSALPRMPNDEGDDYDDNHHEDDKDDDSYDNYHRSILCITKAADDCHDNYHRTKDASRHNCYVYRRKIEE